MTSLSTLFFGQPSESKYSVGRAERAVFCTNGFLREGGASITVPRRRSSPGPGPRPLNRPRARGRISGAARGATEPSVAEVLELGVHPQLVLLAADELDDLLQVVPRLAGDAHALALDGALHLELGVLDQLHDRLGFLGLDALGEGEQLLHRLAALLDRPVLDAPQTDAALGELLHQDLARGLQALLGRAADLDTLLLLLLLHLGVGALEVVALLDLLARLLEGVVDLLLVHLVDDVEGRHGSLLTSPGRRAGPWGASRIPS